MNYIYKQILFSISLLVLNACGGVIPENYRGQFVDVASGAKLSLESGSGAITFSSGRRVEASAKDLSFSQLLLGEPGIYTRNYKKDPDRFLEVFWIHPNLTTRTEDEGHVWFESEVAVTILSKSTPRPVGKVPFTYCERGRVQLDKPSQFWQIGCDEQTLYFDFQRVPDGQKLP